MLFVVVDLVIEHVTIPSFALVRLELVELVVLMLWEGRN